MNIIINGRSISVAGGNVCISNNTIFVDGKPVPLGDENKEKIIVKIEATGEFNFIQSDIEVTVNGSVKGNVSAGNSVHCGDVGGTVSAGNSVHCGKVEGSVIAGNKVVHT